MKTMDDIIEKIEEIEGKIEIIKKETKELVEKYEKGIITEGDYDIQVLIRENREVENKMRGDIWVLKRTFDLLFN